MRSRRDTELLLLLAAAPPVLLLFALVKGASGGSLAVRDLAVPAGLLAAFAAAHLAARRWAPGADPVLLPVTFLLTGIGLAFVTRLAPDAAAAQTRWVFAGVAVLVATLATVRSIERLARYKYTIALAGIALLLLPAVAGVEVNGAKLWLRVGGVSFQPVEAAKVLIVLFLAAYLAEKREVLSVSTTRAFGVWLPPLKHLGPLLLTWSLSLVVLVAERDLGSSLLLFGLFLAMLFVATGRPGYVLVGLALFAAGAVGAYLLFGHVAARVAIWLDPFTDAAGRGYQLVQSLFAFAAGGMTGTGPGRGLPTRIPFVDTDFIFAAVGEELGLIGAAGLVIAYLVFATRGLATAARARSDVAAFVATGATVVVALQAFVIIGGVTRLVPLTGITLPFVSRGGSSVVANFVLLGLLMRAGDEGTGREHAIATTGATGALGRIAVARRLATVARVLAFAFVAVVVNLTYLQVIAAPALANHPANTRRIADEIRQERGAIVTHDGVVLAQSVPAGRAYARRYPAGALAPHVVGYSSPTYGRAGIEAAMNDVLAGKRIFASLRDLIDAMAGTPVAGNDVRLTLDSRVQQAALLALEGRRGACVVLDPRDGRVLALASSPGFDPATVEKDWKRLSSDPAAPLLDRATQSLYPPGSTFKVVTLTGAIGAGVVTPSTTLPAPARIEIGGAPVTNYGGDSYGTVTVERATAASINTVFAQIADKLGAERLVRTAEGFGFDDKPPLELAVTASVMPDPDEMTRWETAWAGVGQPVGEHDSPPGPQATALQMALVAAGIANDGVVMRPYLVESIADPAGRALSVAHPKPWKTACDAKTASTVRDMMVAVVRSGSGRRAAVPGVTVAGKTGTAEAGKGVPTHAWFIAFAPAEDPRVAMAIVLENAGVGGQVAAPAAKPVLETALKQVR
ncbi:FtsW/RodA/SpoVE family cell cycle protein [Coriobacteriia bacterium Es71-Z0120]|uniref:FtsW/RodA/SpoVE family cell cycle protein n=1 Tax=Parvivirga hydrogeniphila TaxID=2939460 RepID=UPI002260FAE5|nr:FtsW/RodA/SpoVE family cell cycle protein [Parvivirga hydrogeniphila]MCL4078256.1 FtsW/RodA/SpoVE family cell cycle protein [Parvivirga hydrogeniphila]